MIEPNEVGFACIDDENGIPWLIRADCILAIKDAIDRSVVYFAIGNGTTMMIQSRMTRESICNEILCAMHKEV